MKLPRVMEITTLSRSSLYSWIKAGSFPAPVKKTRFDSGDD